MKQILFLDDDGNRRAEIRRRLLDHLCDLQTVETVEECVAALAERRYDIVFLDHDLGGQTFVDSSREDCGMEVVRWLKINGGPHGVYIVHTMNAIAAAAMYFELKGIGCEVRQAPFGSPEFYAHLYALLGVDNPADRPPRRSLGKRIGGYFKGLRGRR